MRQIALVLVLVCACKREHPARHVALPPGPSAVIDPSPNPTLPMARALVDASEAGGNFPKTYWRVQIWEDGTVGFSGEQCHGTHRATLPLPRIEQLVTALEDVDLGHVPAAAKRCSDDIYTDVTVQGVHVSRGSCAGSDPRIDNALDLVRSAVGTVPCDQRALEFN